MNDAHFKVIWYKSDSREIFPTVDKKGGIAVTMYRHNTVFGPIGFFSEYPELKRIVDKCAPISADKSISSIVYAPESYKFTNQLHSDFPNALNDLGTGHMYDVTTNVFDKVPYLFSKKPQDSVGESVAIIGRQGNERLIKYVNSKYVKTHPNLHKWKVILAKSNGSGKLGETLSLPMVGNPGLGHTQTFISMGAFEDEQQASNLLKYLKTKLVRTLLGSLKVTQDNKKDTWANVPMQDFTAGSDIDWSKSVEEIDAQLYAKYNLSDEEIVFIESMIKPM